MKCMSQEGRVKHMARTIGSDKIPRAYPHVVQNIIIKCDPFDDTRWMHINIYIGNCPVLYANCSRIDKFEKVYYLYFFLDSYFYTYFASAFHPITVKLHYNNNLDDLLPFKSMIVTGLSSTSQYIVKDESGRKVHITNAYFEIPNKTMFGWDFTYYESMSSTGTIFEAYRKRGKEENKDCIVSERKRIQYVAMLCSGREITDNRKLNVDNL
jgi:hypothetical protein